MTEALQVLITARQLQSRIDAYADVFRTHCIHIEMPEVIQALSEQRMKALASECDGMIVGDDVVSASVLEAAPRLRVVSKWGVGIDNIDVDAAARLGIRVRNTPDVFGAEVADVVIGYLIMLTRHLHTTDLDVRGGSWPKLRGRSLAGKCLGVVGLGSIGRAVAVRARAMEMKVIGTDPDAQNSAKAEGLGVGILSLERLLAQADVVSLNCPLTESSRHLINRATLSLLKPGAFLINTARGPLVDEAALSVALGSGRLAGAALDVFEEEPLPLSSPLRAHPNAILGSHNASNTEEAVQRVNERAVENLLRGLKEISR